MNRTLKLAVLLLLLALCTAMSGVSAESVAINAEDGGDIPDCIMVGETFTVLITGGGSPVGAGTNVLFVLPASGGSPICVSTDSNGKARYKPLITGTLGIKVLNGTVTVAEATVTVVTRQVSVTGNNFTEPPIYDGAAVINMSGEFDNIVTGNIDVTAVADPEAAAGYAFNGDGQTLMGLNVMPDATIRGELDGNDTIRIEICYDPAELERLNINPATLAIWRYDGSAWVKMVNGTTPCTGNGRDGTCVWVELTNLSLFTLVGSFFDDDSSGSSGGDPTYPPGWFETPTPVPTTTATAEPTEPEQSDESETTDESATTGTEGEGDAATDGGETPTTVVKTKGIPGFSAFLVIAGLLAAMYLVLRRRD